VRFASIKDRNKTHDYTTEREGNIQEDQLKPSN